MDRMAQADRMDRQAFDLAARAAMYRQASYLASADALQSRADRLAEQAGRMRDLALAEGLELQRRALGGR